MKTTALEYLRGLANAHAATEQVTISVATLRDALAEKQAGQKAIHNHVLEPGELLPVWYDQRETVHCKRCDLTFPKNGNITVECKPVESPVPSTGEMRHLAERLTETACAFFAATYRNALANQISIDLIDAPEIIALQQAKETTERLERENQTLYDNCIRIQNEARQAKEECEAIQLKAVSMIEPRYIFALPMSKLFCKHGIRGDAHCVTCALDAKHEQTMKDIPPEPIARCRHGVEYAENAYCPKCDNAFERDVVQVTQHTGKQAAYDSCTHGWAPEIICSKCEPTAYAAVRVQYIANRRA